MRGEGEGRRWFNTTLAATLLTCHPFHALVCRVCCNALLAACHSLWLPDYLSFTLTACVQGVLQRASHLYFTNCLHSCTTQPLVCRVCCNALLAAYARAQPTQWQKAIRLLDLMWYCGGELCPDIVSVTGTGDHFLMSFALALWVRVWGVGCCVWIPHCGSGKGGLGRWRRAVPWHVHSEP